MCTHKCVYDTHIYVYIFICIYIHCATFVFSTFGTAFQKCRAKGAENKRRTEYIYTNEYIYIYMCITYTYVQPIPLGVTFSKALSKLKAQSLNFSFHWNVAKETFELWALIFETAFENVTPSGICCICTFFLRRHREMPCQLCWKQIWHSIYYINEYIYTLYSFM